ncbi:MAG: GNAT family N-acetyltransferase [Rhodospirillales bacterium]|nr:GNAT family N-acetyltransferase [Rhodospirillales bacterium]
MNLTIRAAEPGDKAGWLPLWRGYLEFYDSSVPDTVTDSVWAQISGDDEALHGLVAVDGDGGIVGMINYVLHANTWTLTPMCYLEDLFVSPPLRGHGIGLALIEHLQSVGKRENWRRIYWMTHKDNAQARLLYDKVATESDFLRYDLPLD